mmetsp:Transcript_50800/g.99582  ORF Transcript_50800/g.99582 Transcript_50800/m.99582 type:complete len:854 (+) Transcript_50800:62-2623(+)|eukprot:CAMPEP_0175096474 /NCGR_PEP_ID=MMETSP0086_2-20121207/4753_1 /TAXON_ID=136419 /ORGANISM="Unknown Unknown, Strain D1" /LENGTH=853 /DNA_ID=CAMNT_0016369881 /DNA_START=31 /DNA_END=2592 /DNA_ORIENTATION=+
MFVIKRDGKSQPVLFDKITSRIKKLCYGLNPEYVDPVQISQKVCMGVYKGVTTSELDELAAETAAHLTAQHPDYGQLAARIVVSNLHKDTKKIFSEVAADLYNCIDGRTGKPGPLLSKEVYDFIQKNESVLNSAIVYDRDYWYDYFGFKTLQRAYLMKIGGKIVERPQHMLMRVAVGIHCGDLDSVLETYNLMSCKWFTHATPTLFNAGTPTPQMSSCFLLTVQEDSIQGIFRTLEQCALISKSSGGIGLSVHNVRASGSYIRGTNGEASGLVPMLRVFNNTARFVTQGGGKRNGSFAMYLEPWHADIFDFLDLKKNHGIEEARARDLFYGLWVCDLFMKRIEKDGQWTLFCPDEAPGLCDVWGDEFEQLYTSYEERGLGRQSVKARALWQAILESQTETGTPYLMYKDACNRKSNQQNLGTIRSSNLCTEIVEYTAPDEVAVCNLASIALPKFVVQPRGSSTPRLSVSFDGNSIVNDVTEKKFRSSFVNDDGKEVYFDMKRLYDITYVVAKNLNKVIDVNYYPVEEARNSNFRHRPIGIGVQGLADAFILLRLPFDSPEAQKLNKEIFETIYFAALSASCDLAEKHGHYESFPGSPISKGIFQFDMWNVTPSDRWDWAGLRKRVVEHGVRNSLLLAPMPTASTSQILGNNECFEPYTSNLYLRRTLAGEFVCVSRHLLVDLVRLGLWNSSLKNKLIAANGSVQKLREIPAKLKALYKTAWEMSGKVLIDMAADRGAFICQSQSFNAFMTDVNFGKLTSMHFYAWKKGLKTGMYYLRTQAAVDAIKFTVDAEALRVEQAEEEEADFMEKDVENIPPPRSPAKDVQKWRQDREKQKAAMMCSLDNKDECLACGS